MLIKVEQKCRVCNKVPEEGYFPSRIFRYDHICPKCSRKVARVKRLEKLERERDAN